MDLKQNVYTHTLAGDESIQQMLREILQGLKAKLVQPVLEQNIKIAGSLDELKIQEKAAVQELLEKIEALEYKIQQIPLAILASIRDAINQAGGGNRDDE